MAGPKDTQKRNNPNKIQGPTKTFNQDGHWIVKPGKTPIITCDCGTKYLKTRPGQRECLRCHFLPKK